MPNLIKKSEWFGLFGTRSYFISSQPSQKWPNIDRDRSYAASFQIQCVLNIFVSKKEVFSLLHIFSTHIACICLQDRRIISFSVLCKHNWNIAIINVSKIILISSNKQRNCIAHRKLNNSCQVKLPFFSLLLPSFVLFLNSSFKSCKKIAPDQADNISIFQLCLLLKMRLSFDLEGRFTGYKSRKQIMTTWILPKKKETHFQYSG